MVEFHIHLFFLFEVKECRKLVTRTCHVLEELGMAAFRDALKNCGLAGYPKNGCGTTRPGLFGKVI